MTSHFRIGNSDNRIELTLFSHFSLLTSVIDQREIA